jgi:hypothetical protein
MSTPVSRRKPLTQDLRALIRSSKSRYGNDLTNAFANALANRAKDVTTTGREHQLGRFPKMFRAKNV